MFTQLANMTKRAEESEQTPLRAIMNNDNDIKRLRNMIAYADLGDCDPDVLSRLLEALLLSQGKIRAALQILEGTERCEDAESLFEMCTGVRRLLRSPST